MEKLNTILETYLVKKAPAIPANIKELIVKYAPYLILILMLISLPGILFALGIGVAASPFAYLGGVRTGIGFSVGILISLASLVLEILALPGLFKRSITGWNYSYYATLVSALSSLFSFNLGALVIGTLISLYILFQVKSYYK